MKSAEILYQLRELRETWRRQSFAYTLDQQAQYNKLVQLRRQRVRSFYDNDEVFKTSSKAQSSESN